MRFKQEFSKRKRLDESQRIKSKYPDRVPIICEKSGKCTLPDLDKHKYLVPADMQLSQMQIVIRKRMKLGAETAIFLTINGTIPSSTTHFSNLYEQYKDEDGFLYIEYTSENVFG